MTSQTTEISSLPLRRGRRSRRKERSPSSLSGMFETESTLSMESGGGSVCSMSVATISPPASPHHSKILVKNSDSDKDDLIKDSDSTDKYSPSERQELLEMTRKLRQAKRRLLLKSAATPVDSVERFREILLRISFDDREFEIPNTITTSNTTSTTARSMSSNSHLQFSSSSLSNSLIQE